MTRIERRSVKGSVTNQVEHRLIHHSTSLTGLLVGACVNQAPELYGAAIADGTSSVLVSCSPSNRLSTLSHEQLEYSTCFVSTDTRLEELGLPTTDVQMILKDSITSTRTFLSLSSSRITHGPD